MSKDTGHWCGLEGFDPAYDSCPGCESDKKRVNGISAEDFTVNPDRYDMVTNPMHYTVGGYEALDVIKAKLSPEEWRGAMKFNVLKYLMRANYKGSHDQDCKKAEFYAKELSNALLEKEVPSNTTDRRDAEPVREERS